MPTTDKCTIIIGQGIFGNELAYQLYMFGKSFIIFENRTHDTRWQPIVLHGNFLDSMFERTGLAKLGIYLNKSYMAGGISLANELNKSFFCTNNKHYKLSAIETLDYTFFAKLASKQSVLPMCEVLAYQRKRLELVIEQNKATNQPRANTCIIRSIENNNDVEIIDIDATSQKISIKISRNLLADTDTINDINLQAEYTSNKLIIPFDFLVDATGSKKHIQNILPDYYKIKTTELSNIGKHCKLTHNNYGASLFDLDNKIEPFTSSSIIITSPQLRIEDLAELNFLGWKNTNTLPSIYMTIDSENQLYIIGEIPNDSVDEEKWFKQIATIIINNKLTKEARMNDFSRHEQLKSNPSAFSPIDSNITAENPTKQKINIPRVDNNPTITMTIIAKAKFKSAENVPIINYIPLNAGCIITGGDSNIGAHFLHGRGISSAHMQAAEVAKFISADCTSYTLLENAHQYRIQKLSGDSLTYHDLNRFNSVTVEEVNNDVDHERIAHTFMNRFKGKVYVSDSNSLH